MLGAVQKTVESFLFWKWPYVSSAFFVIYQLIVSYPAEFLALVPAIALLAQV